MKLIILTMILVSCSTYKQPAVVETPSLSEERAPASVANLAHLIDDVMAIRKGIKEIRITKMPPHLEDAFKRIGSQKKGAIVILGKSKTHKVFTTLDLYKVRNEMFIRLGVAGNLTTKANNPFVKNPNQEILDGISNFISKNVDTSPWGLVPNKAYLQPKDGNFSRLSDAEMNMHFTDPNVAKFYYQHEFNLSMGQFTERTLQRLLEDLGDVDRLIADIGLNDAF